MRQAPLIRLLNATVVLVLFANSGLGAEDPTKKPRVASTPEEAVKFLVEAAKADDVDAFIDQLGAHSRAVIEMGRALESYYSALEDKFGKDPRGGDMLSVKREIARYRDKFYEVRDKPGDNEQRVALTVWVTTKTKDGKESVQEETWIASKEPTGWKVVFPPKGVIQSAVRKDAKGNEIDVKVLKTRAFDPQRSAAEEKMARGAAEVLERITKDVNAGKYKTRAEAGAALDEAKRGLMK